MFLIRISHRKEIYKIRILGFGFDELAGVDLGEGYLVQWVDG
jgi:hypothetical protein